MLVQKLSAIVLMFMIGCCPNAESMCKPGDNIVINNPSFGFIEGNVIDVTKNGVKLDDGKWYEIDQGSLKNIHSFTIERVK